MKQIPLNEAIEIIELSRAIVINNECVVFAWIDTDGEYDRIIGANWTDVDYREFECNIYAEDNKSVGVEKNTLIFKDDEGEEVGITPLFEKSLD